MSTISDHVLNIPPVTRFFTVLSLAVSFAYSLNVYGLRERIELFLVQCTQLWSVKDKSEILALNIPLVFTTFFVPQGLLTNHGHTAIFNIYHFYFFSKELENGKFRRNFADYLWFVLVCGTFIVLTNVAGILCGGIFDLSIMWHMVLLHCLTFVYLRENKSKIINYLGLIPLRCYYLPFFDAAISLLSAKDSLVQLLQGFFAGYLYLCLQSDTIPLYNLVPGCYGRFNPASKKENRVGASVVNANNDFPPAIFDLGYWKAPAFLYKLLRYPQDSTVRQSAFTERRYAPQNLQSTASTTGFDSKYTPTFRGQGHRLGN